MVCKGRGLNSPNLAPKAWSILEEPLVFHLIAKPKKMGLFDNEGLEQKQQQQQNSKQQRWADKSKSPFPDLFISRLPQMMTPNLGKGLSPPLLMLPRNDLPSMPKLSS